MTIDLSKYNQKSILGEGAAGIAYLLQKSVPDQTIQNKSEEEIVVKVYKKKQEKRMDENFSNEIKMMKKVSGYPHFPKLLDYNKKKYEIYMTSCGEKISIKNVPSDWKTQLLEILDLLKKCGLSHNSSAINNTCVKDNVIYFIDFAHSGKYRKNKRNLTKDIILNATDIYDAYDSNKTRASYAELISSSDPKTEKRRRILLERVEERKRSRLV